jgi:hypothetical protein
VTTADPEVLIRTPLGLTGSGRVRYGAAMALHAAGRLSDAQLEVYRETAAHDARDPAAVLAERGLPPVTARAGPLEVLRDLACDHLNRLSHPGRAEVRAALARGAARPVPCRSAPNPVVARWLDPALAAVDPVHAGLARAIAAAAPLLPWTTCDAYRRAEIGEGFAGGHAFASILGEAAPFPARDVDMGLFLIAPGVLYRDHAHAAPELYAPLTGPHGWRFGSGAPRLVKPAHRPVWNPPFRPHLTKVGRVPFLGFFVRTRDVAQPARVIPAPDWAELEAWDVG